MMKAHILLTIFFLGTTAAMADTSLISKDNEYVCAPHATFRGEKHNFSEIKWYEDTNTMLCCYLFKGNHSKPWNYCPPDGRINLQGKVKPGTCRVDKENHRLTDCVPLKD